MDVTGRIIYHEQRKIGPFEKWSFNRQMLSGTNSNGPLFVNISTDKGYHQSAKLVIIDK
jgi:hypothetical protein